ncbi:hypothetical protein VTH82DRAFT_7396 [Thermothelomyces myriococcoides]
MVSSATPTPGNTLITFLQRYIASSSSPREITARFLSTAEPAPCLKGGSGLPSMTGLDLSISSTTGTIKTPLGEPCPGLLPSWEAEQTIRAFIDSHWPHRADHIRIDCRLTLPELRAIGRLPREEGFLACRRLVRVPAIHEEVALSLWEYLARETESEEAGGDACVVSTNNSRHEAVESRTGRQQRLQLWLRLKSLVTRLIFPEERLLLPRRDTAPTSDRNLAGISPSCPFCSGDCTASFFAVTRQQQQQQQQQTPTPGFWQQPENASSVSSSPPLPLPSRLSGDTLTASHTGEGADHGGKSVSKDDGVKSKSRPVYSAFTRLRRG